MKDCIRLSVPTGLALFAGAMMTATAMGWDPCPEDVTAPQGVEQQDLAAVLARWGDPLCDTGGAEYPCPEDVTAPDGVEQQDLAAILARWGDPLCIEPEFNDECVDAFDVAIPSSTMVDNTGATYSGGDLCGMSFTYTNDLWYHLVGTGDEISISTCAAVGTITDSFIAVYDDCAAGAANCVVANDDFCGLLSEVQFVTTLGQDYYISIGVYSGTGVPEGTMQMDIEVVLPCEYDCVDTEGEGDCFPDYVDTYNGGANSVPCVFSTATCGVPVCGSTGNYTVGDPPVDNRDTDWYQVMTVGYNTITVDVYAEANMVMYEILGDPCAPSVGGALDIFECEAAQWVSECLPEGTYTFFLSTPGFTGADCGSQYEATFTCTPCDPPSGACCYDEMTCVDGVFEADCLTGMGTYMGDGVVCTAELCLPCVDCVDTEGEGDCFFDYVDTYNGGANSVPCVFSPATCGVPICGSTGNFQVTGDPDPVDSRDTDWYQVTTPAGQMSEITVDVLAEADMVMFEITGDPCGAPGVGATLDILACEPAQWVSTCLEEGTYTFFLSTPDFTGTDCGSQYEVTFTCVECIPALGACCLGDETCYADQTIAECVAVGGLYMGDGVLCTDNPCPLACVVCVDTELEGNCFEDYDDTFNGGANAVPCIVPSTFSALECGVPFCGSTGTYINLGAQNRDTDWFLVDLVDPAVMTFEVTGSSDLFVFMLGYDNDPCDSAAVTVDLQASPLACEMGTVVSECSAPGTYMFWVGPQVFEGVPCGTQYEALLTCEPCIFPSGACCMWDQSCVDGVFESDCIAMEGLYMGDDVVCEAGLCVFPTGACCLGDDSCEDGVMQWECELVFFGDYAGDGVVCTTGLCPIPAYCDADHGATGGGDEYLSNVTVGSINNTTPDDGIAYHDYTSLSTDMVIGTPYNFSCVNGYAWSLSNFVGFVDWNQDFDFDDPGEEFIITDTDNINGTAVITPPVGALTGPTRMRVRVYYGSTPAGPCDLQGYGETEDYTINVLP